MADLRSSYAKATGTAKPEPSDKEKKEGRGLFDKLISLLSNKSQPGADGLGKTPSTQGRAKDEAIEALEMHERNERGEE